jgi:amidophosphoribosyltransferase
VAGKAGIAASDGTHIRVSKAMGCVNDVFNSDMPGKLPGHTAMRYVYSTAGESRLANAQPIVVDSMHGQLAIGHNGNIVNASELRDALVRVGAIFQATTDTEIVVHLYARSRENSPEAAIVDALSQVRGAYSLVMMTMDRLIGARDPHGFRPPPSPAGRGVGICSETCALI